MTTTPTTVKQPTNTDVDPIETQEWLEALQSVITCEGAERANFLLHTLTSKAKQLGLRWPLSPTAYCNSPEVQNGPTLPDDPALIQQLLALLRWNAVAMVVGAGKKSPELGGHLATYASIAVLYEIGFHYFFKAHQPGKPGDFVYFQGHSSPGVYARAFLEGRLTEEQLAHFRQEVKGKGISSYPHPWLMPDFWEFPTVSMGLGPLQAIYQARFLKYLENRQLLPSDDTRKVWVFCGDGEMDEPESVGALTLPAREKLDNLIFIVNCNLQRLDGPVRGNGKIIEELEKLFYGAGWHIIKVIWGEKWDPLLAKDKSGLLLKRMQECTDGEYQLYVVRGGAYFREHFFGKYPELTSLVADYSDEDLEDLAKARGGHDPQKVYAAYAAAAAHKGQPVVILAKSVKGYGMGKAGEAMNVAHQQKKLTEDDLHYLCDRFNIPIDRKKIASLPFVGLKKQSTLGKLLHKNRQALGGYVPSRYVPPSQSLTIPDLSLFKSQLEGSGERAISTTMVFVRLLSQLLRDKHLKERLVPIVPDESRTFGMEGLFRQIGIYSPLGQTYEPEDKKQVMYYREAVDGQLLEEGLNEAGATSSWIAAGTAYSTCQLPMIPFYIYYSMFGFQRIGDLAWLAGDMRTRGFLLGATAGRTTLAGEGLQHQDGHSHIQSSLIPNCISYDPTFSYELAVIMHHGLKRMYEQQEDVYFYITLMNENYTHPAMPKGAEAGIIKGMYLLTPSPAKTKCKLRLLGCGTILNEVRKAAELLYKDYKVGADIWSVTSFTELRRDALAIERYNQRHPKSKPKTNYVTDCLSGNSPVLAVTDYVKLFPDQIRAFVPAPYHVLGTDGFGRSDTRAQLREFFEVDARSIAYTAIYALVQSGSLPAAKRVDAAKRYKISSKKANPTDV